MEYVNKNARDGYVYAVSSDQGDNGSNLRLGCVSADAIVCREEWEWVCAFDRSGAPAWSHSLSETIPILSIHRSVSLPEMVYFVETKRYLLLTWRHNGKVERSHRKDNEYFYAVKKFYSFDDFKNQLIVHNRNYNNFPMRPLGWFSPNDTLKKFFNFFITYH